MTAKPRAYIILVLMLLPVVIGTLSARAFLSFHSYNPCLSPMYTSSYVLTHAPHMGSPGIEPRWENLTQNLILNGDFESWTNPGTPRGWTTEQFGERYHWIETTIVNEGMRSAGMESRTISSSAWSPAYWYNSSLDVSLWNLSLSFDWYLDENPNPGTNQNNYKVYLSLYEGGQFRSINYYLNGSVSNTNTSSVAHFHVGGPSQSWNSFDRNITDDYLQVAEFPDTINPNLELRVMYFQLVVSSPSSVYTRGFIDDVVIRNGSALIMGGELGNGNFEASFDDWYTSGNHGAESAQQSSTSHSGLYSLNLTGLSNGYESNPLAYTPFVIERGTIRLTQSNLGPFSLWWRIDTLENVTQGDYIRLTFIGGNITDPMFVHYYFGYGGTTTEANDTDEVHIRADNFNSTGSWNNFNRILWMDVAAYYGTSEFIIERIELQANSETDGSLITGLFDEISLIGPSLNDGGYEDQLSTGSAIRGWGERYFDTYPAFTLTDFAYDGAKAANLTLADGQALSLSQSTQYRSITSTTETYLTFTWRLENYIESTGNSVYFRVRFGDGTALYYYVGITKADMPGGSNRFNVTNANQVGSWNIHRTNLALDYLTAYGSFPATEIRDIDLRGATVADGVVELLLDDLYLFDDPEPTISNLVQSPLTPEYDDAVTISTDVVDTDVDTVWLYWRINGYDWTQTQMAPQSGDSYAAIIPIQATNTLVEYYILASDTFSKTTRDPIGTMDYEYVVGDFTDPEVSITSPVEDRPLNGTITITVSASDVGIGINHIEIYKNTTLIAYFTSPPYSHSWDTVLIPNGNYELRAVAYDNAGNSAEDTQTVQIYNEVILPQLLDPLFLLPVIGIVPVVSIAVAVVLSRRPNDLVRVAG